MFAENGTVLILHESEANGVYKIKAVVKLLGAGGVFDEDSMRF